MKILRSLRRLAGRPDSPGDGRPTLNPLMHTLPSRWPLRAVAAGWLPDTGPDYVGIGVPKAGTSWWHTLLLEHPGVVANRTGQKELHFFAHHALGGLGADATELYRSLFARPDGGICGEWSPGMFSDPMAMHMLREAAPQARLILMLRDPVARYLSHVNQMISVRGPFLAAQRDARYVFDTFSAVPEALAASRYGEHAERLCGLFPRERILVLQYERCVADPLGEIARSYAFLGLDRHFRPPSLTHVINRLDRRVPALGDAQQQRLAALLAPEVQRLHTCFPEVDPGLWPACRPPGGAGS